MTDEFIFTIVSIVFLFLFIGRFIYYRLWIKGVIKLIFSKTWCPDGQEYDRKELEDAVIDVTNNTKIALSIIEYTTAKINTRLIPIIYGDINLPTMYGKPGTRKVTKGIFTFSNSEIMRDISLAYPTIFEFGYAHGDIHIFFINRVKDFKKLLLREFGSGPV